MPCPYIVYFTYLTFLLRVAHFEAMLKFRQTTKDKLKLTDQKYCRLFPATATFVLRF